MAWDLRSLGTWICLATENRTFMVYRRAKCSGGMSHYFWLASAAEIQRKSAKEWLIALDEGLSTLFLSEKIMDCSEHVNASSMWAEAHGCDSDVLSHGQFLVWYGATASFRKPGPNLIKLSSVNAAIPCLCAAIRLDPHLLEVGG